MEKNYKLDLGVYIGRFQPFHNGHLETIRYALTKARRLIILIGSHDAPFSIRNPWTTDERMSMIRACFSDEERDRIILAELEDFTYNDQKWSARVQEIVSGFNAIYGVGPGQTKIGITGYDKDNSTYYLKEFPQWESILAPKTIVVNATDMRDVYFNSGTILTDLLPPSTCEFLLKYKQTSRCTYLKEEFRVCKDYMIPYRDLPFPPTFNTVDAVVIQAGHILLIKRKAHPGQGLWALPGGFINVDETLLESCIRELKEETKIDCPVPVIKGSLKDREVFDNPKRSSRARTITTAFLFPLEARKEGLYKVKGGDDAAYAKWFPLSEFFKMRSQLFEDHYAIGCNMIARIV